MLVIFDSRLLSFAIVAATRTSSFEKSHLLITASRSAICSVFHVYNLTELLLQRSPTALADNTTGKNATSMLFIRIKLMKEN